MQKTDNDPTISVVIPTHNRAHLIGQAIDSVLAQTYKDYEIIVVDDGSTDNTRELLSEYWDSISYIYQENQGASAARNTGIKVAKGNYISFLDSDDWYLPNRIEKHVEILEQFNDISIVYSNFSQADANGNILKREAVAQSQLRSGYIFEEVLLRKAMFGNVQTWTVNRKCFEEIGYFNTELKMSEDRELSLRLAKKYKIYAIKEPLVVIRQIPSSLGRCSAKEREYYRFKFLDILFDEFKDDPVVLANKKKVIADYYFMAGLGYIKEENNSEAQRRFLTSLSYNPFHLRSYIYFLMTFFRLTKSANKLRKLLNHINVDPSDSVRPSKQDN